LKNGLRENFQVANCNPNKQIKEERKLFLQVIPLVSLMLLYFLALSTGTKIAKGV
jgi:hypothetical protein